METTPLASSLCLANIPTEILSSILQHLRQPQLCALMPLSKNTIEVVAAYLYHNPVFASTYRFAQFSKTVTANSALALLVHVLDLSNFEVPSSSPDQVLDLDLEPLIPDQAGWRELQHINSDIYYIYHRNSAAPPFDYGSLPPHRKSLVSFAKMRELERRGALGREVYAPQGSFLRSSHPLPSPMLKSWAKVRDVPIGAVCRVLAACRGLGKVNISRLLLASDFLVLPEGVSSESFKQSDTHMTKHTPFFFPTASFSPLEHSFSTDSPLPAYRPMCYNTSDRSGRGTRTVVPIYADEIIYWLSQLPHLTSLQARECNWLTTVRVWKLLCDKRGSEDNDEQRLRKGKGETLNEVDFRGCGRAFDYIWAVKGTRGAVEAIVASVVDERGLADHVEERRYSPGSTVQVDV